MGIRENPQEGTGFIVEPENIKQFSEALTTSDTFACS